MLTLELIQEWHALQLSLVKAKAREMQLRKLIVSEMTNSGTLGTVTSDFFGYELKAENKVAYSFPDKEALNVYLAGNPTAEERECIMWKPSVKVKHYTLLPSLSPIKNSLVVVKPAAPTLKVISIEE